MTFEKTIRIIDGIDEVTGNLPEDGLEIEEAFIVAKKAVHMWSEFFRSYEELIDKIKDGDIKNATERIDKWCIEQLRGIISDYYVDMIINHKDRADEKSCDTCFNNGTYHCAECENKSDYEQAQAYSILREAVKDVSYDGGDAWWVKKTREQIKAQAEVNAHTIKSALDNGTNTAIGTGGMRDATPEEQEAIDKYIKSISKPTGVNFWDLADGEYISKTESLKALDTWDKFGYSNHDMFRLDKDSEKDYVAYIRYDDAVKCINGMSSVATSNINCIKGIICRRVQDYGKSTKIEKDEVIKIINAELPSVAIPNKVGHLEVVDDTKSICSVCGTVFFITVPEEYNDREVSHCPFCGCPMEIER